ncbi:hypothetical protein AVEN_209479-1 [Araneus ventricosus]|uniref:Uncharacterized protein n=1 Tax=Araneus ventricosus TaxID=182803 RepID=A0A4Y2B1P9_ARAVE|nr:hypothetical protein AVEN_209479-1 [Araneus ventricosus]
MNPKSLRFTREATCLPPGNPKDKGSFLRLLESRNHCIPQQVPSEVGINPDLFSGFLSAFRKRDRLLSIHFQEREAYWQKSSSPFAFSFVDGVFLPNCFSV